VVASADRDGAGADEPRDQTPWPSGFGDYLAPRESDTMTRCRLLDRLL